MNPIRAALYALLIVLTASACSESEKKNEKSSSGDEPKIVKKFRDDGSVSSLNPVDEEGFVNGVKVNLYEDGRTVHSKISFEHGVKSGAAIWYYRNGKVFEHTGFKEGRRDGLTRKYYKNGQVLSECTFRAGDPMPGLVEYNEDGSKVSNHPTVRFKKTDKLAFENIVYLEISSSVKSSKVKYFYKIELEDHSAYRSYIESKAGKATLEFYVAPGTILMRKIEIFAELPTKLGNTLVKEFSYQLAAKNR